MSSRQDILSSIISLAKENGISAQDIALAMNPEPNATLKTKARGNLAMTIFSIMGGIFIFAGISSYISMQWHDMNSAIRVLITLGSGFVAYIIGVVFFRESRHGQMIAPLLLVGAAFEVGGLFVLIDEYFNNHTNNWRLACLTVFAAMLLQQGLTFFSMRIPILLLTSLWFGALFFGTAFDMLNVPPQWNAVIVGLSLLTVSYSMSSSQYQRTLQIIYILGGFSFFGGMQLLFDKLGVANLGEAVIGTSVLCIAYGVRSKLSPSTLMLSYLCGAAYFLYGWFDTLHASPFEPLYIAVACSMVYFSVIVQSTLLLIISVFSMLSYIGYFTAMHFADSASWPLLLIILGILFFMIGAGALRIKKKYMS